MSEFDYQTRELLKETEAMLAQIIADAELKMKSNDENRTWRFPAFFWRWRVRSGIRVLERHLLDLRRKWKGGVS